MPLPVRSSASPLPSLPRPAFPVLTPVPFPCSLSLPSLHAGPAKAGPDATGRPYTVPALAGTIPPAGKKHAPREAPLGASPYIPPARLRRREFPAAAHAPPGHIPCRQRTVPSIGGTVSGGTVPAGQATGPAIAGPESRPPRAFAAGEFAGGGTPCRQLAAPYRAADRRHRTRPPPETAKGRKAKDAHRRPQKSAPMLRRRRLAAPECRRPIGRRSLQGCPLASPAASRWGCRRSPRVLPPPPADHTHTLRTHAGKTGSTAAVGATSAGLAERKCNGLKNRKV